MFMVRASVVQENWWYKKVCGRLENDGHFLSGHAANIFYNLDQDDNVKSWSHFVMKWHKQWLKFDAEGVLCLNKFRWFYFV
jgi:hypothetical protein